MNIPDMVDMICRIFYLFLVLNSPDGPVEHLAISPLTHARFNLVMDDERVGTGSLVIAR